MNDYFKYNDKNNIYYLRRRIMKEIRKENIVKTTTLSEEEMIEVVGGTRVNGFVNGNFS